MTAPRHVTVSDKFRGKHENGDLSVKAIAERRRQFKALKRKFAVQCPKCVESGRGDNSTKLLDGQTCFVHNYTRADKRGKLAAHRKGDTMENKP